jgi:hypothetical protein
LGNTPDIQTLPFDKCLLLVEFLAGNQFLKGLLELSEGAAPPIRPLSMRGPHRSIAVNKGYD